MAASASVDWLVRMACKAECYLGGGGLTDRHHGDGAGEQLGQSPGLPVFLYGTAHSHARQLPRLRRELGYFSGTKAGAFFLDVHQAPPGWGKAPSAFTDV